jgi:hypothetical protein
MSIKAETYLPIAIIAVNLDLVNLIVGIDDKKLLEDLSTLA